MVGIRTGIRDGFPGLRLLLRYVHDVIHVSPCLIAEQYFLDLGTPYPNNHCPVYHRSTMSSCWAR